MFQTALISTFHQLPSNPLSDLKCPLEAILEKVQRMAMWHCPLTPCPQALPDQTIYPFRCFLPGPCVRGQGIPWARREHCLTNVIFIGYLCLTTHSCAHTSVIIVPCENHPGSTPSKKRTWSLWSNMMDVHRCCGVALLLLAPDALTVCIASWNLKTTKAFWSAM